MTDVFFSDAQLREMREHVERATAKRMRTSIPIDVYIRMMRIISAGGDRPEEVRRELLLYWDYAAWRYYQSVRSVHPHLPEFPCPLKADEPEPRPEWRIEREKSWADWNARVKRNPALIRPPSGNVSFGF